MIDATSLTHEEVLSLDPEKVVEIRLDFYTYRVKVENYEKLINYLISQGKTPSTYDVPYERVANV